MVRHTRSRNVGREHKFRHGLRWDSVRLKNMRTWDVPYVTRDECPSMPKPIKFYTWPKKDMVWIGGMALRLYFFTHPEK